MERRLAPPPEAIEFHPEKINGNFLGKDFISIEQLTRADLEKIFSYIPMMEDLCLNSRRSDLLAGIVVGVWFDSKSASTRTLMSTKTGISQLSGYPNEKPENSSDKKGESFKDSILMIEMNCDLIAMRNSRAGAAEEAAQIAKRVPVINLGDGNNGHPTQAVGDLFTINKHSGLDNQVGVVILDPKHSRTIHSLLDGMCLGKDNVIYSLAQPELQLPDDLVRKYKKAGLTIIKIKDPAVMPKHYNFAYINRPQVERWDDALKPELERLMKPHIVNNEFMRKYGCEEMILLDPLPRVGEILEEVDNDSRAAYMQEARNAAYGRMVSYALHTGRLK